MDNKGKGLANKPMMVFSDQDLESLPVVRTNNVIVGELSKEDIKANKKQDILAKQALKRQEQEQKKATKQQLQLEKKKKVDRIKSLMLKVKELRKQRKGKNNLYLEAINQVQMGYDFSTLSNRPLDGFDTPVTYVKDPNCRFEGNGIGLVEEFGTSTLISDKTLRGDCYVSEGLGIDLNPLNWASDAAKSVVEIGGKLVQYGSDAFKIALSEASNLATQTKITSIVSGATKEAAKITSSAVSEAANIATGGDMEFDKIIADALKEAASITGGALKTVGDVEVAGISVKQAVGETLKATDPTQYLKPADKLIRGIPLVGDVYSKVDEYSGGLITKTVDAASMPTQLLRGNVLGLTDEKVSKARFIGNMVFYAQVAAIALSGGAAAGAIMYVASNMQQGPLGETQLGRDLLGLAAIAAVAYTGGGSITANLQKEVADRAQEKAAQEVSKKLGGGTMKQALVMAAMQPSQASSIALETGRSVAAPAITKQVTKKLGTTGGLISSVAVEAAFNTAETQHGSNSNQAKTEKFKLEVMSLAQDKVVKTISKKAASKLSPEAQKAMMLGTTAYSAYESDEGFVRSLTNTLGDKAYNKTLDLVNKRKEQLLKDQIDMLNKVPLVKDAMDREKLITKLAETEVQIYDLQNIEAKVLEDHGFVDAAAQDLITKNSITTNINIAPKPDLSLTPEMRKATAEKISVERGEVLAKLNLERTALYKKTVDLGSKLKEVSEKIKKLRSDAEKLSLADATKLLEEAYKLEQYLFDESKTLAALENDSLKATQKAVEYQAASAAMVNAAAQGRYPNTSKSTIALFGGALAVGVGAIYAMKG